MAARFRGVDIFTTGNAMAGSANVFWHIGHRTGAVVFAGDVAKGSAAVLIAGMLYDVTFLDGTCIALFDGCDEVADFDFTNEADALLAAQALLDQVFIDSALGLFDIAPELTFGCGALFSKCSTVTSTLMTICE